MRHASAANDKVLLAPDLHENLAKADQFELESAMMIDDYIQANGLNALAEELPQLREGYEQPIPEELDLKAAGINTVIWAMGYTFDCSLVKLPICDGDGFPIQSSGVTSYQAYSSSTCPGCQQRNRVFYSAWADRPNTSRRRLQKLSRIANPTARLYSLSVETHDD